MKMESKNPFLSIICTSRERPAAVAHLLQSIYQRVKQPESIEVYIYVDDDDPTASQVKATMDSYLKLGHHAYCVIGPRRGPKFQSYVINEVAAMSKGDWIWSVEDEIEFQTDGFDEILRKRISLLPDNSFLIACPDNNKYPLLSCDFIVGKKWFQHFGFFYPPDFPVHIDPWISYVLRSLNREIYEPRVKIRDIGARGAGIAQDAVAVHSTQARIFNTEEAKEEWSRAKKFRKQFHRYIYGEKFRHPFLQNVFLQAIHRKISFFIGDVRNAFYCLTTIRDTRLPLTYLYKTTIKNLLLLVPKTILRA